LEIRPGVAGIKRKSMAPRWSAARTTEVVGAELAAMTSMGALRARILRSSASDSSCAGQRPRSRRSRLG
jgi:hypothetical protein